MSHILMNAKPLSLRSVCAFIQREAICKKIMPRGDGTSNARAYLANVQSDKKSYKGKRPDLNVSIAIHRGT